MTSRSTRAASVVSEALRDPERAPVGVYLDDAPNEHVVRRMWQQVQPPEAPSRQAPDWHTWNAGAWTWTSLSRIAWSRIAVSRFGAISAATAVLVIVLGITWWTGMFARGALEARHGSMPSELRATDGAQTLALSDGSNVIVAPHGHLEILGNDGERFVTALRAGEATFVVEPGGPRRWVVEAGIVRVEVLGTVFRVVREPDSVRVDVLRGKVAVKGDMPEGERQLVAGESIIVPVTVAEPELSSDADDHDEEPPGAASPDEVTLADVTPRDVALREETPSNETPGETTPSGEASAKLPTISAEDSSGASRGTQPGRLGAPPGLPRSASSLANETETSSRGSNIQALEGRSDPIGDLLQAADDARRAGDSRRAADLFERVVREAAASDSRRGLAALSLARTVSDPVRIARVLRQGRGSLPHGLRESALARLVVAEMAAGQTDAGRAHAAEYISLYPRGVRLNDVRRAAGME